MSASRPKTWTLPDHLEAEVERLIEAGAVRGLDEIVAEGLSAFDTGAPDHDIETLRRAVLPVIAELDANPGQAIPLDRAWAEVEAHITRRRGEA